jgi:hypothetical protein
MRQLMEDLNGGPKQLRKMGKHGECSVHPNSYASMGLDRLYSIQFSWKNRRQYEAMEGGYCIVFVMGGGEVGFFGIVPGADGDAGVEIARVEEVTYGPDGYSLVPVRRLPSWNIRSNDVIYYIFPPTDPVRLVRWNKYRVIFKPMRQPGKSIIYFWRSIYLRHMIIGATQTVASMAMRSAVERVFGKSGTGNAMADSAITALTAGLFDYAVSNHADLTEWKTFTTFLTDYVARSGDRSTDAMQFINNTAIGVFDEMFRFYSQISHSERF